MGATERMFWKFSKFHETKAIALWELQNIMSDHKSQNLRERSYDFLFNKFSTMQHSCRYRAVSVHARTIRFDKAKMIVGHFGFVFNFGACGASIAASVLHSKTIYALKKLFMHLQLSRNEVVCWEYNNNDYESLFYDRRDLLCTFWNVPWHIWNHSAGLKHISYFCIGC